MDQNLQFWRHQTASTDWASTHPPRLAHRVSKNQAVRKCVSVTKRLSCQTVTYVPELQYSGATLAAQHIPGSAVKTTGEESPSSELPMYVGQGIKRVKICDVCLWEHGLVFSAFLSWIWREQLELCAFAYYSSTGKPKREAHVVPLWVREW